MSDVMEGATLAPPVEPAVVPARGRDLNLPLRAAMIWLLGSYGAFLLVGDVEKVDDLWGLSVYVIAAAGGLALGYWVCARRYATRTFPLVDEPPARIRTIISLVRASAIYVGLYGLSLLAAYGAKSPADIITNLQNPGAAYLSKFDVYSQQAAEGANPLIQVLTLSAFLYVPMVPLAIIYWRRLFIAVKVLVALAALAYASFFLFIGTMKGLGDLAIYGLVGMGVLAVRRRNEGSKMIGTKLLVPLVAIGVVFVGYMAYSQSARLTAVGGLYGRFDANPAVTSIVGPNLARGLSVVAAYPTHGYLGLSYNLGTPFEWSQMRGGSKAIDSYLAQYGFGESVADTTYPARTEVRTGWPQGMYWATAYPWLASDLTFPGVIVLMVVLGWWMCRLWVEASFERSVLALLLFAQLALFVAYIPANNQIGISRPATIGFVTTILLYAVNQRNLRARRRKGRLVESRDRYGLEVHGQAYRRRRHVVEHEPNRVG